MELAAPVSTRPDSHQTRPLDAAGPEKVWTLAQLRGNPFGRTHLFHLVSSGQLPAKRAGRYILVRDADWRTYLDSLPDAARGARP